MFRKPTGVSSFLVPSFSFLMVSWSIKFSVVLLSTSAISSAVPLNEDRVIGISSQLSLLNMYIVLRRRPLHQENLKILFYTFLHFFVKKLKKYENDKSFTCQTTF